MEGRPKRGQLKDSHSKAPYIYLFRIRFVFNDFRREVKRSPNSAIILVFCYFCGSKVANLQAVVFSIDKDIAGLYIPMNNVFLMKILQGLQHFLQQGPNELLRKVVTTLFPFLYHLS